MEEKAQKSTNAGKVREPEEKRGEPRSASGPNGTEPKKRKIGITETGFRDAHQSIMATRLRTSDMLPICEAIDEVGYHSIEMW